MVINYLREIFTIQERLQKYIHKKNTTRHLYTPSKFEGEKIFMISSAILHEVVELQRETGFKWWKQEKLVDYAKVREECIDIWHFLVQLSLEVGLSPDDLYKEYLKKNRENKERQDNGY